MQAAVRERCVQRPHRGDEYVWTRWTWHTLLQADSHRQEILRRVLRGQSSCGLSHRSEYQRESHLVAVPDHVRGYTIPESGQSYSQSR